jgi:hypothetical protein
MDGVWIDAIREVELPCAGPVPKIKRNDFSPIEFLAPFAEVSGREFGAKRKGRDKKRRDADGHQTAT